MDTLRFDARETSLILSCAIGSPPSILYWGRKLSASVSPEDVSRLLTCGGVPGSADVHIPASLALEPGLGLAGPCGFSAHRRGQDWGSRFDVAEVEKHATGATLICRDSRTKLSLTYEITLDPASSVLTITTLLTNEGDAVLDLGDMATAFLPIPQRMTELIGFTGRWANEFMRERLTRFSGAYVRENRRGRTSHDSFPAIILCTPSTDENSGEAFGLHLAWSGNHRVRLDTLSDGRVLASLGALLLPGEIRLDPGASYYSPQIVAGYSSSGLAALSRIFHRHIRSTVLRPQTRARPVHYNSWEAVYFNHDLEQLKAMATRAADIGVERFVLDDGWFGSRRNDASGLGDWTVSETVYPDGLTPLIDHVTGLGMEMGLWFEPEMVNPDSDLFRAHPDWVLQIDGVDQIASRNQVALDISLPEVADHLFGQIDAILSAHDIGYIKWDMNRDLNHPGDAQGRPCAHAQVSALYALIDRVRAKHPKVEIETCSSGGGRADMGILAHSDRIWTSDTNDALDRQSILRGASFFLPLEVLGAHVGPARCHITGRTLSMAMRAGTALMGHMGLELNLLTEPEEDMAELKAAIALYKDHRALLHSGEFQRLDLPDHLNGIGVVALDQSEALYSVAVLTGHSATLPGTLCLNGLDATRDYQLRLIWPANWRSKSSLSVMDSLDLGGDGTPLSGEALMTVGLQLPWSAPETVLLFHLKAVEQPKANAGASLL
jgi:alpha-galactosidase